MHTIHLIDTPRRTALAAHFTSLRTKLKEWEKSFAELHSGRKPGKEDIKACTEIANTYKEYNRVRDVLAGKLDVKSLDEVEGPSPTARKGSRKAHDVARNSSDIGPRGQAVHVFTPRKAKASPRQERSALHPNLVDPHAPPTSTSPRPYLVTAIGPTPQRDGKVLGLFDLLSDSKNSSQARPSTRKRKVDTPGDYAQAQSHFGNGRTVAQTPSRKKIRSGDGFVDVLDHLAGDIPNEYKRHSRTPASEGRKFMLNQFFATPSTMRFAAIADGQEGSHYEQAIGQDASAQQTPLRRHVLGDRANSVAETELPVLDATPTYLKRSYSFKDRLLSVSASANGTIPRKTNLSTPPSTRIGPPTLRKYISGPKPLSEIVRGLRQMDDERHDDDLEALREMEGGLPNVLVRDSQRADVGAGAEEGGMGQEVEVGEGNKASTKMWKKKGQKRTTRRANMRPVKIKPRKENQWVAEDSGSDDGDGLASIVDLQRATHQTTVAVEDGGDEVLGDSLETSGAKECESVDTAPGLDSKREVESDAEFDDDSGRDEDGEPTQLEVTGKKIGKKGFGGKTARSTRKVGKNKDKSTADKAKQKKTPTINPNAVSHQNFRSLKIRNKNSKAKGGKARFGRKGR